MSELHLIIILCAVLLLLAIGMLVAVVLVLSRVMRQDDLVQPMQQYGQMVDTEYENRAFRQFQGGFYTWRILLRDINTFQQIEVILNGPKVFGRIVPGYAYLNDYGIGTSNALSRRQFQLFDYEGRVYIQNLSRVNYTFLNRQPADQPVIIQIGDMIQTAGVTLQVCQMQYSRH